MTHTDGKTQVQCSFWERGVQLKKIPSSHLKIQKYESFRVLSFYIHPLREPLRILHMGQQGRVILMWGVFSTSTIILSLFFTCAPFIQRDLFYEGEVHRWFLMGIQWCFGQNFENSMNDYWLLPSFPSSQVHSGNTEGLAGTWAVSVMEKEVDY